MRVLLGLARIIALGGMVVLAGCQTVANSLSQDDIAALKLTGVSVSVAPDARIQWDEAVRAYGVSKALMDDQMMAASETPEGRAYIHAMLAPRIKTGLEQQLTSQIAGSRPVSRSRASSWRRRRSASSSAAVAAWLPTLSWSMREPARSS